MTQARAEIALGHLSVCFLAWFVQAYFNVIFIYF